MSVNQLMSNVEQYEVEDQKKIEAALTDGDKNFIAKIEGKREKKRVIRIRISNPKIFNLGKIRKKVKYFSNAKRKNSNSNTKKRRTKS